MLRAVAGRIRIEGRVVLAIGEFFERSGHAVADDRDGGLHDGELLFELFDALGDRIEAGARSAERRVAGVAEVTHGKFLAREFLAHLGLKDAVVILAFDEHVADEQDAIAVFERELPVLAGGEGARVEGEEGTECQQGGGAGHGTNGRRFGAFASEHTTLRSRSCCGYAAFNFAQLNRPHGISP